MRAAVRIVGLAALALGMVSAAAIASPERHRSYPIVVAVPFGIGQGVCK